MALQINIDKKYPVANVLSRRYRHRSFPSPFMLKVTSDGKEQEKTIDVKAKVDPAWSFITRGAAACKECNEYFLKLPKKRSLKQLLKETDITLHLLEPKDNYTYADLPAANTAGTDIAIHPELLLQDDSQELACTLIHELAHVNGAPTDPNDKNAGAAEMALKYCQCAKLYRPDNLGLLLVPDSTVSRIV